MPSRITSLGDGTLTPFQHADITRQFYVAHFRGSSTLFNKHTFEPDIEVNSVYIPSDKAYCSGWAFEAAASKAQFRRIPRKRKSCFAMMSVHCQNAVAEKRSIALNILLAFRIIMMQKRTSTWLLVTLVVQAGGADQDLIKILIVHSKKNVPKRKAPCATRLHTFAGPGGRPSEWTRGFVKPPTYQ